MELKSILSGNIDIYGYKTTEDVLDEAADAPPLKIEENK